MIFTGDCGHETLTTTNLIPILLSGSGGPGDDNGGPLGSVHWSVGLGRVAGNKNGGAICFDVEDIQPGMLSPDNLIIAAQAMTDIVWTPFQTRVYQILAPECFVQIDEISPTSFRIDFYTPEQVFQDRTGTNLWHGVRDARTWRMTSLPLQPDDPLYSEYHVFPLECYRLKPQAEPFVSYAFAPSGASSFSIREIRPGCETKTTTYSRTGNSWIKQESDLRTEMLVTSVSGNRKTMTWTTSVSESDSSTIREVYLLENGRELLLESIVDPDGLALVTSNEYYLSGASRYKLRKTTDPNGAWTTYEYDSDGRETEIRTGWLSGGENDPCKVTLFSYAPFLPTNDIPPGTPFDNGKTDSTTPRIESVLIGGIPVSKTLRSIAMDSLGYRIIEEVRLLNPSETNLVAAWSAPDNPRSLAVYMPDSDYRPCSRLPMLVVNEDGTATHYDYESGVYNPGEDGMPGTFEPIVGGAFFRTIATHGSRASFALDALGNSSTDYAGVPLKTTRDIKIETRIGKHELLRETQVCTEIDTYERIAWATTTLNETDRIVATRDSNGKQTNLVWIGNLLSQKRDEIGTQINIEYDGLGHQILSWYIDPHTHNIVTNESRYDVNGQQVSATIASPPDVQLNTSWSFDKAGRVQSFVNEHGLLTQFSYWEDERRTWVKSERGYGTTLAQTDTLGYFQDGSPAEEYHCGTLRTTYRYGVMNDSSGCRWKCEYYGPMGTNSLAWTIQLTNPCGQMIRQISPSVDKGLYVFDVDYNPYGNAIVELEKFVPDCGLFNDPRSIIDGYTVFCSWINHSQPISCLLRRYDDLGNLIVQAIDMNENIRIDYDESDIVVSNSLSFVCQDGVWWKSKKTFSFPETGEPTPSFEYEALERLSNLGQARETIFGNMIQTSEEKLVNSKGISTVIRNYSDRDRHITFQTSSDSSVQSPEWAVFVDGNLVTNMTKQGAVCSYDYDALGRPVSFYDGRGSLTYFQYNDSNQLVAISDNSGILRYEYDDLGRITRTIDSCGNSDIVAFDKDDNITNRCGSSYPVSFQYDEMGRETTRSTITNGTQGTTVYNQYDKATGLLTNTVTSAGRWATYSYYPSGRLKTRTNARGITTEYRYGNDGRLLEIQYSDDTPDITFNYDRVGNLISARSDDSFIAYKYDDHGCLTNEMQNGVELSRLYDSYGRLSEFKMKQNNENTNSLFYSYDALGRLQAIVSPYEEYHFSFVNGTKEVDRIVTSTGFEWSRSFEGNGRFIDEFSNSFQSDSLLEFRYSIDSEGRRIAKNVSGNFVNFPYEDRIKYNARSELIAVERVLPNNSGEVLCRFQYAYDDQGNRMSMEELAGGRNIHRSYVVGDNNQYSLVANDPYTAICGTVVSNAVLSINGNIIDPIRTDSENLFWSHALPSTVDAAHYQDISILAVQSNGASNGVDIVQSIDGSLYVPSRNVELEYDLDGNLVSDGRYRYYWNAENQLIRACEMEPPSTRSAHSITFKYDYAGRQIEKNVDGIVVRYIWKGDNRIAEITGTNWIVNVFGPDMFSDVAHVSQVSMLLSTSDETGTYFPCYEANGNILAYADTNGSVVAFYDYSPTGELIGTEGRSFLHRFASQPYDTELKKYEYIYRYYDPVLGRWLSPDAFDEESGYRFVNNNFENGSDYLGLSHSFNYTKNIALYTKRRSLFGKTFHPEYSATFSARGTKDSICCKAQGELKDKYSGTAEFAIHGVVTGTWGVDVEPVRFWRYRAEVFGGIKVQANVDVSASGSIGFDGCSNQWVLDIVVKDQISITGKVGGFARIRKRIGKPNKHGNNRYETIATIEAIGYVKGSLGVVGQLHCEGSSCVLSAKSNIGPVDGGISLRYARWSYQWSWRILDGFAWDLGSHTFPID